MKKLVILGFLIMPFFVKAQEFQRLKAQADSFKNVGYYDRAIFLYSQALSLYRQRVSEGVNSKPPTADQEWLEALISSTEATYKAYRNVDVPGMFWRIRYGKNPSPPVPKELLYYEGLTPLVRGKEFHRLLAQADSLKSALKYHRAIELYNAAIEQITSYKETVPEIDFMIALFEVSDAENKLHPKPGNVNWISDKYKRLIGLLPDRIAELRKQGITNLITFKFYDAGGTGTTYIHQMSYGTVGIQAADNTYLVWLDNNEVYMQAFSDVNVNPPLTIGNERLRSLVRDHYTDMLVENMKRLLWHGYHERYYTFNFYKSDGTMKEVKFQESDIRDPHPPKSENRFSPNDVESYNANIETFLYQFELQATEAWWEYNKRLKTDF